MLPALRPYSRRGLGQGGWGCMGRATWHTGNNKAASPTITLDGASDIFMGQALHCLYCTWRGCDPTILHPVPAPCHHRPCSILHLRHLDFGLCYFPLTSANCTHQACNLASDHLLLVHSGSWAPPEHSCHLSQSRGSPCADTSSALLWRCCCPSHC